MANEAEMAPRKGFSFNKAAAMKKIMDDKPAPTGGGLMSPDKTLVEGETHDMMPDGKHMAAQDMIDAFHAKDPKRLKESLGAYIDLHCSEGNKPEP